jgi:hypothetical protein
MNEALDTHRYFVWAVRLSIAALLLLLLWPMVIRVFVPVDPGATARIAAGPVSDAVPPSIADLGRQAAQRAANPAVGIKTRTDLETQLYAQTPKFKTRVELQAAARILAQDMVDKQFRSDVDSNGLGPGDRVALIDRKGFYASLNEFYGDTTAKDPSSDFKALADKFKSSAAAADGAQTPFNQVGVGCAEKSGKVVCVRLLAYLGGELEASLPLSLHPGDSLPAPASGAALKNWQLQDPVGTKIASGTFPAPARVPPSYHGPLSVGATEEQGAATIELDGPIFIVQ